LNVQLEGFTTVNTEKRLKMEVGQTGTVFVPGKPFELGEFMACKILEVHGEKLRVELENGATGIIEKTEFTPRYMVIPSNAALTEHGD
jgi:hypothetical protein